MTRQRALVAICLLWAPVGLSAGEAKGPPASQPAPTTAPVTTQPARAPMGHRLAECWRRYQATWAGTSVRSQLAADGQLVRAILAAKPGEIATLRDLMGKEYDRLAAASEADDFHCGRIASRLALAWTNVPVGKELPLIQAAVNSKLTCEEVCRWAERAVAHFAGRIDRKHWQRYKILLPGTTASMMSLIPSRAIWIDRPGRLRDRLTRLQPRVEALAGADEKSRQQYVEQFEKFYLAIEPYGRLEADKQAVRKLVMGFQAAYNRRDDKAFAALWPAGHPATRPLASKTMAEQVGPTRWAISRWEPLGMRVRGDLAAARVLVQFRGKDGKESPLQLQTYFAKRTPAGWRLN